MLSVLHSMGPQLANANSSALYTLRRPPVTVSPIKLLTSSVPSKMYPSTKSAAAWGLLKASSIKSGQGALYTKAIAPATQGLANEVPLVLP